MTGNKLIDYLLSMDDDTSICELIDLIKTQPNIVKEQLIFKEPVIDFKDSDLVLRLTKICAILEFKIPRVDLPNWCFNENLYLKEPIYVGNHLDDFIRVLMFVKAPQAFLNRNVFFSIEGLQRI